MTLDTDRPMPALADDLESDLTTMFRVEPSRAAMERVDERVLGSLRAWDPAIVRRSRLRPGRRAGVIGLLAATFVVGGATGSLQALYALIAGPFDVPWQRGTPVGLSQVVDGYRVTIDRAYADATRLALAISVVDELERAGTTQVMAMSALVTDEDGEYSGMGATSAPDGPFAAVNIAWKVPAALPLPSGPRTFHVVVPEIRVRDASTPPPDAGDTDETDWSPWRAHPGPWTFDFDLDVDGGTTMTPAVTAEVDGVTVRVSRVIAASDIVRVEAAVDGPPGDWAPIGQIAHGNRTARFVVSSLESDGTVVLLTGGGLGRAAGEWTITIEELVGDTDRLAGPWVLRFSDGR